MSSVTGKNVVCSYGKLQPDRSGWNSRNGNKTVPLEDLSVVIIVGKQIKGKNYASGSLLRRHASGS